MIFIITNHPHCFTFGRGLQKGKDPAIGRLVEFNPGMAQLLKYPVHKINRGGGLTFHYPGQWIFYPIVNLNGPFFNLKSLTYWILDLVKKVLEEQFKVPGLTTRRALLGLWSNNFKIASVGIGIERFVTHHGLALNFHHDQDIFLELAKTNPCGLGHETYKCVDQLVPLALGKESFQRFNEEISTNAMAMIKK